jgi:hypothetical protein
MKLSQAKHTSVHRVCLYGPPKGGKTLLAGKLAEHYNVLWFDLENGHNTLFELPMEYQERIELVHIPDSKEFPIAVETMLKVVSGKKVKICEEHGKVSCPMCISKANTEVELNALDGSWVVVIDSGTQFTNSAMAHILKGQPDTYKPEFSDWGNLKVLCDRLGSQLQVAPYNLVFITHEEEVELEDKTTKIVPVLGSSKTSRNTAKYFDHVVYCGVRNKKHIVGSSTTYAMSLMTGSRNNVKLEDSKTEPSLLEIFTHYRDGQFVTPVATQAVPATNAASLATTKLGAQGTNAVANLAALKAQALKGNQS